MQLDREQLRRSLTPLLDMFWQTKRRSIHTGMPGIVDSFNPVTRRGNVQGAPRLVSSDGSSVNRSLYLNVPFLFPSIGGFTLLSRVRKGDNVWLMFSERGLRQWKKEYGQLYIPDPGHFFSSSDAVALPGFGPQELTPATTTGMALQSDDGTKSVRIEDDRVEIYCGASFIRLTNDSITASSARIDLN